jgi:hypothetical protein
MRATLHESRTADKGSIAFSVAAHIVAIALIASITFRYPLGAFFSHDKLAPTERIQFVRVQPAPAQSLGTAPTDKVKPKKAAVPAPLVAPVATPTELPPVPPPAANPGSPTGTGTGAGGVPGGVAANLEPGLPDARIELKPNTLRLPLTMAERNDSAVKAIFMDFRQAEIAAEETKGRSPRDWTIERDGQKYGLDSQYIYLGRFKLPSAILAALPFKTGGVDGAAMIRARNADWIRDDIYSHSQGLSEDDFRAAVKRIRERKDKERQEQDDAKKAAAKPTPIIP